jgi:hypothetical protein
MSLFRYKVEISGGKEREGLITAKTEADARKRVASEMNVLEWKFLKVEAPPSKAPAPKATKVKPLSKLQKMLYLQSGRCFFCGEKLDEAEASIEHLNPRSKGGSSTEDNEIVCHAALNQTFGNMDLKRKFEFTLRAVGPFKCPSR